MSDLRAGVYKHYKGGLYLVLGVARHSETEEKLVAYVPLGVVPKPRIVVRPYNMFFEDVEVRGVRPPGFYTWGNILTKKLQSRMISWLVIKGMTVWTTKIGQGGETKVANLLQKAGFKILARNWRTKVCEIDIIASKNKIIYFVEVKYRSNLSQGSGLEYITPKKLKQMHFAAEIWIQQNDWEGDYRLVAAELSEEKGSIKIVELD